MKRILPHPPREERPKMWRSLAERENDPQFIKKLEREFAPGADQPPEGISRRNFMRLMGASAALAGTGLTACRRPESFIAPFSKSVEWTIPGKFLFYATSMPSRNGATPLIMATVDGRPTKAEGNPLHPVSNGATDGFAQASVLDLYDPFRSKKFVEAGEERTREEFDEALAAIRTQHEANGGEGLALLLEKNLSPTRMRLLSEIQEKYPEARWYVYEPLGNQEYESACRAAFGDLTRPNYRFEAADVVLAIGSDFLNCNETGLGFANGFYTRRNPDQAGAKMNRLYAVENHYTLTGGMADHRLRCKAAALPGFVKAIAAEIADATASSNLASLVDAAGDFGGEFDPAWIKECAADLVAHAGASIVLGGPHLAEAVQLLILGINEALGNFGKTITGRTSPLEEAGTITELADRMRSGSITTLLIHGGNPVYNAPANLDFAALLESVPNTLRLGMFVDETSTKCKWHLPAAHYLEAWGDNYAIDGTYTAQQPMIMPLYGGLSELQIFSALIDGTTPTGSETVRATFDLLSTDTSNPELAWQEFLRNGFKADSAGKEAELSLDAGQAATKISEYMAPSVDGAELVFIQSSSVDDGRYANNSWLQETPDFVTKLTWDNALWMAPSVMKEMGVKNGTMIEVSKGNRKVKLPAIEAPGSAVDSFTVALGYGRRVVPELIENVGFDVYPLRTTNAMSVLPGVTVTPTSEHYPLARTQEHASMEGRDFAREGTVKQYSKDPAFAQTIGMDSHIPPNISLYENPYFAPGSKLKAAEQWAMTVDLNTCTGCNACLVACQAENNVPVVGKEQVIKGRDMAWIRIDRWFAGDNEDEPEMVPQAIMCQHCENAPCETVCPVNATVHSEDGLNLMAYNRCIGTRYCANNCPWKVRRFNYFDYNERPITYKKFLGVKTQGLYLGPLTDKGMAESLQLQKNPNVTVRMRGVMEKCTFCIQRIEEAKIGRLVEARDSNKYETPIAPFKTACQQACPSDAIVFGDEANEQSRVARLRKSDRAYVTLNYLNARPRVSYLARIKNPNPKMPGADLVGHINSAHHGDHGDHGKHGDHGDASHTMGEERHDVHGAEDAPKASANGDKVSHGDHGEGGHH